MTREEYEKKMAAAAASWNNNIFNRTPEIMLEEFYWGPIEDNAPIKIFTPLFAMLRKATSGNVNFLWVNPTHESETLLSYLKENYPENELDEDLSEVIGKEIINCYREDDEKEIWLLPYTEDKESAAKAVLEVLDIEDWFVEDINVEEDYEALADLSAAVRKISEDHAIDFPDLYADTLVELGGYEDAEDESDDYDEEGDFDDLAD